MSVNSLRRGSTFVNPHLCYSCQRHYNNLDLNVVINTQQSLITSKKINYSHVELFDFPGRVKKLRAEFFVEKTNEKCTCTFYSLKPLNIVDFPHEVSSKMQLIFSQHFPARPLCFTSV